MWIGCPARALADEVADGKVLVERKMWADESEATGDHAFDGRVQTELLGGALGVVVGVGVGGRARDGVSAMRATSVMPRSATAPELV